MARIATPDILGGVVQTKLQVPQLRDDVGRRPRLHEALVAAVTTRPLTLVSAPPGYGKTTLLSGLSAVLPGWHVAWLALDEADNDTARFLAGLIAALHRANPATGLAASALLANLPDPGAEARRVIGVLINDLLDTLDNPCALILDDLHTITEPQVFLVLDYLVERLPANLHLVIATRHDPPLALARLRARRSIAEIRLPELRLTIEETEQFLRPLLGQRLDPALVTLLHERTEGWAAGLSLLLSALDHLPADADHTTFLAQLTTSDRYIFDYLAEEVLRQQDATTRDFLLLTAVLDELTPQVCAALTGRADAGVLLEELYRRNLFVLALDPGQSAYRYHDLFREFLRQRLLRERSAEELRRLQRRAALAATQPARAIGHWLAAGAWDEAAAAIGAAGEAALARGEIGTLRNWIESLPDDIRRRHPPLAYLLGVIAWERWDVAGAQAALAAAQEGFRAEGDAAGQGAAEVQLASSLIALHDFAGAQALLERTRLVSLTPAIAAQRDINRAWQGIFTGDWAGANEALDATLDLLEATDDPRALRIAIRQFQSEFIVLPGGTTRAARLGRLAETRLGEQPGPLAAYLAAIAAVRHLWIGESAAARAAAERALAINAQFAGPETTTLDVIGITATTLLATWHALAGDHETAERYLTQLLDGPLAHLLRLPIARGWRASYLYPRAQSHLLAGRIGEAQAIADELQIVPPREWPGASVLRALLRGKLALIGGHHDEALAALREASAGQRRFRFTTFFGVADLSLAWAHLDGGQPERAASIIAAVLAEHARDHTPGAILWEDRAIVEPLLRLALTRGIETGFVTGLLDRLGQTSTERDRPPRANNPDDPARAAGLTQREREILRLVAAGASNAMIAEQLSISVHTVKRHVANLLAKLGAESRTQAAARARDLGLH